MGETEITKIIFAQAVITFFAVLLGYVKLSQEMRKSKSQKVYDMQLDRLRRQLSEFYGPLYMLSSSTTQLAEDHVGNRYLGRGVASDSGACSFADRIHPFIEDRFARRARYSKILFGFHKAQSIQPSIYRKGRLWRTNQSGGPTPQLTRWCCIDWLSAYRTCGIRMQNSGG